MDEERREFEAMKSQLASMTARIGEVAHEEQRIAEK